MSEPSFLTFAEVLELNGISASFDPVGLYRWMMAIANRRAGKIELAEFLRTAASAQ